ncbi:uncharacterized protein V1516DRAFT_512189 [Lipomyces oligophaga]|uniref:uncharacterized protein n=1 Tax=Lipomyces oligophaga TaxID=45792 RepID=UPI0034CEFF8E
MAVQKISLITFATCIALTSVVSAQGTVVLENLPVYDTPITYTDPSYEVSPQKLDFTVSKVATWGSLTDWKSKHNSSVAHITSYEYNAVTFCPIGNHSFWVSGLTAVDKEEPDFGIYDGFPSYVSVGMSPLHVTNVVSDLDAWWTNTSDGLEAFMSFASGDFSSVTTPIDEPLTVCVPINSTTSIHVWNYYMEFYEIDVPQSVGSFLVSYTLSDDGKTLTTYRPKKRYTQAAGFGNDYLWGKWASIKVEDYIYLYVVDVSSEGNSQDLLVARAPVEDVMDISSWTYYSANNATWLTTAPELGESRKDTLAIYSLPDDIQFATSGESHTAGGSIFYSEYHDAYLMVFVASDDTTKYIIEYAPTPVGPWSTDRHVLYTDAYHEITKSIFSVYAFSTPLIGEPAGKQLLISTKSKTNSSYAIMQKLIFD